MKQVGKTGGCSLSLFFPYCSFPSRNRTPFFPLFSFTLSLSLSLLPIPLSMVSRFVKNDRDTRQRGETSPPLFFLPSLLLCLLTFPIKVQIERGKEEGGEEEKEGKKIKEISRRVYLAGKHEVEVKRKRGENVKASNLVLVPSHPPLLEIAHALLFLDEVQSRISQRACFHF